jgi:glutamyl-tRNA reductase
MVTLQNIDQLNEFVLRNAKQQHNLVVQAEEILRREAAGFLRQVTSEQVNPVVAKFRSQLGRICSEELERLNDEYGPFTQEQYEVLNALAEHLMQRISGSVSRTLADRAEAEQEALSNLLRGMFQAEAVLSPSAAEQGEQSLPCAASTEET